MFSFLVEALSRNRTIILLPELFPYLRQNCSAALRFGCGGRARLFLQELSVTQGPIKFYFRRSFTLLHHLLKELETTKPNVQAQLQILGVMEKLLKMSAKQWGGDPQRSASHPAGTQTKRGRCLRITRRCSCKSIHSRWDLFSLAVRKFCRQTSQRFTGAGLASEANAFNTW